MWNAPVYRHRMRRPRMVVTQPEYIPVVPHGDCSCKQGNGFEQKIKENPLLFVLGALLAGFLLAKKQ